MSESIQEAFDKFVGIVKQARKDHHKKQIMGLLLAEVFEKSGKTKNDFWEYPSAPNRATVDRWLAGKTVPHPKQIQILQEYLFGPMSIQFTHSMSAGLLSKKIRPVILFLIEEENAGREITEEELNGLLWIAERSKSQVTTEMMRIFLGRQ